jgi:hypothetical protein
MRYLLLQIFKRILKSYFVRRVESVTNFIPFLYERRLKFDCVCFTVQDNRQDITEMMNFLEFIFIWNDVSETGLCLCAQVKAISIEPNR